MATDRDWLCARRVQALEVSDQFQISTTLDNNSIIKRVHPLVLPFHPNRLSDAREPLIEDLLELSNRSKQDCVNKIIEMIEDFHAHGFEQSARGANLCRFLKPFGGAVYELKSGKVGSGGPRVYLLRGDDGMRVPDPRRMQKGVSRKSMDDR